AEHAESAESVLYKTDSALSANSAISALSGGDLVWIGNWGDEERTAELDEFLLQPVRALGLRASVYGVRYPAEARERLAAAGIAFGGWLPHADVPPVVAGHQVAIPIPRRPVPC